MPPSSALTIDEQGMAKTAERKLEVARRIYDIAVGEYGFRPEDLVFDDLTFTLATGDPEFAQSAVETIEGIRLIKAELPGVLTSLGCQQCLLRPHPRRPRRHQQRHAVSLRAGRAGYGHRQPGHITPYAEISAEERELAEDLIFNRRPDALQRLIEHFEQAGPAKASQSRQPPGRPAQA